MIVALSTHPSGPNHNAPTIIAVWSVLEGPGSGNVHFDGGQAGRRHVVVDAFGEIQGDPHAIQIEGEATSAVPH